VARAFGPADGNPMIGRTTLLINPPLVNGVAFTRQGRCQERDEVLGTTKPPYSLVVIASLFRARQIDFRVIDQTAERLSTETVIARLDADGFRPGLVVFCSTTPTLEFDTGEMVKLKRHFGAPLVCFGPHASAAPIESMEHAPDVDAMVVGEPEDAVVAIAELESINQAAGIPGVVLRTNGTIVANSGRGVFAGFLEMPTPAWDLLPLDRYRLPLVNQPYVLVETSRGCPYTCDFCVVPLHHGHKFRERPASVLVDEIARAKRVHGIQYFYLWGDTVTLNAKTFSQFCEELIARDLGIQWFANARADNLVDLEFVKRLKRSGCWMLSMGIESESDAVRKNMMKRLERQKITLAFRNLREAGIKSFAFFIYGYPGETPESMEQTTRYAIDLDADFANFYPAVPYPGTALFTKAKRDGLLTTDDWTKMEYAYYVLEGNGLNEEVVMDALKRARRRFFLRPSYMARHVGDIGRMLLTSQGLIWKIVTRMLLGGRERSAASPPASRDRSAAI
jgi:anaerobic magnesium-protoporphyrin IX monomethyl ester cyclase